MSHGDPTPRVTSQERIALNLIVSSAKPWNGQPAHAIRAPMGVLQRLVDRGLLRPAMDAVSPFVVRDDTLLWITPAGRGVLAAAKDHQ